MYYPIQWIRDAFIFPKFGIIINNGTDLRECSKGSQRLLDSKVWKVQIWIQCSLELGSFSQCCKSSIDYRFRNVLGISTYDQLWILDYIFACVLSNIDRFIHLWVVLDLLDYFVCYATLIILVGTSVVRPTNQIESDNVQYTTQRIILFKYYL